MGAADHEKHVRHFLCIYPDDFPPLIVALLFAAMLAVVLDGSLPRLVGRMLRRLLRSGLLLLLEAGELRRRGLPRLLPVPLTFRRGGFTGSLFFIWPFTFGVGSFTGSLDSA